MDNTLTATSVVELRKSRSKKFLSVLIWALVAVVLLFYFTLARLPEVRINNFIQGHLSNYLADKGITLAIGSSKLDVGFGVTYRMKDVKLNFPPPASPGRVDEISVSPSLLKLLIGKIALDASILSGEGVLELKLSASPSVLSTGSGGFHAQLESSGLNLARIGLLPLLTGIQGGALLNGSANLEGDFGQTATWNGRTQLEVKKFVFEQQSYMGFALPRMAVSESTLNTEITAGKIKLTDVKFGKPGSNLEDLYGTVTGEVTLAQFAAQSALNLQAKFGLSQSVIKSMVLLEALLVNAKQQDGSYAYSIMGTGASPLASPLKL